jgi:3alpha(or 20beta)-hydroxysteroid dehydrogenase
MKDIQRLANKIAIITGAARGQGAHEARRFVEEGARVVLTDLSESGEDVAKELGESACFVKHDVGDEDGWRKVVEVAVRKFGDVNVLVNNAGIFRPASFEDTTSEAFEQHFRVNQLGMFLGVKSVLSTMKSAGGGSIINISSIAGLRGYADMIAYCSTKWGGRGVTLGAARELSPFHIRVNSIHPGLVNTPMLDDHSPEALAAYTEAVPLGRLGTPEDVAEIVIYLASDLSSNMTGAEICTDGGLNL